MANQALGGCWGLWSCRGQVLVGQLGSQSLSANQVAEGPTQHLGSLTLGRYFHLCLLPVRTKSSGCPSGTQFPDPPVHAPARFICSSFWGWAGHTPKG